MTENEQAVRETLSAQLRRLSNAIYSDIPQSELWSALVAAAYALDAKDVGIAEKARCLAEFQPTLDELRARAEQAEARVAELTTALAKQTEQQDYPCSRHCAGYLREQDALAKLEQAEAALAEERKAHQAFREELSEAVQRTVIGGQIHEALSRFILPAKPADPLRKLAVEMVLADGVIRTGNQEQAIRDGRAAQEAVAEYERRLRAAIERAGGTISFEGEG